MERLLGLRLVMGMGGGADEPPAEETMSPQSPKSFQVKVDAPPVQVAGVDPVVELANLGAKITRNGNDEVVMIGLFDPLWNYLTHSHGYESDVPPKRNRLWISRGKLRCSVR